MKNNLLNFRKSSLFILYILGFIFAFSSAIPAYINSSFLISLTSEQLVGVIYSVGSILTLVSHILIPKILRKYGNYKVTLVFVVLYFLNYLSLAFSSSVYLILFSFIISGSISTIIYFDLDIFLEHDSSNIKTGRIRSVYLTCINLAWLFSPVIAGIIVGKTSYRMIYFVVALIMVPIILIISSNLKNFKDPDYKTVNILQTLKNGSINPNIKNIWICSFMLQLFYSFMVIYTPIYLNQYIGFDWGTIGIIFSIMLLPFIMIEIPIGYIADKILGEKEILTVGFIIIAISTAYIPLISSHNWILWAAILFMTRVGAAMVEVMNDTYFFKQVNDKNLNLINLYRTVTPIAYIIAPIIATILTFFIPLGNIFYIIGLLMIFSLRYSLAIRDTK